MGRGLDKASIAIGQETSRAEVCRQTKRAVQPLGEHALGASRLVVEEDKWPAARTEAIRSVMYREKSLQKLPTTEAITRPFYSIQLFERSIGILRQNSARDDLEAPGGVLQATSDL